MEAISTHYEDIYKYKESNLMFSKDDLSSLDNNYSIQGEDYIFQEKPFQQDVLDSDTPLFDTELLNEETDFHISEQGKFPLPQNIDIRSTDEKSSSSGCPNGQKDVRIDELIQAKFCLSNDKLYLCEDNNSCTQLNYFR